MAASDRVRVGMYGAGAHAVTQHLPNLKSIPAAEVVAVCDIDGDKARSAAREFGIPAAFTDGLEMVEKEYLDALWSVVPASVRPAVEVAAAEKGAHLFCEKPQALDMKTALRIDDALKRNGLLGTVCFRERYRPIFEEAKRLLADKEIVHVRFQSTDRLPSPDPDAATPGWETIIEGHANFLGWGPHAIDYVRFVSGLDIETAQAFFCERGPYRVPLSAPCSFRLSNGATMSMTFLHTSPESPPNEAWFLFYYEGGYLAIHRGCSHIEMNGETVYVSEEFQPWLELDRTFIEAVRSGSGSGSGLRSDFSDGLKTLAPLLAAWESSRRGGAPVDVDSFVEASRAW